MSKRLLGRGRVDVEVRDRVRDIGTAPHDFAFRDPEYRCLNCGKVALDEDTARRLGRYDRCPKAAA